ncbi:Cdc6/Cdc18 family protein [Halorubrum vacuolatum]|nr:hypothetical protein [Halorubrum vacuolatum]
MGDSSEEADPIKESPLWEFVKEQEEDMQVGGESLDYLKVQLEETTRIVWHIAAENARERNVKTIEEEDVREAFKELVHPHMMLVDAREMLNKYQNEFQSMIDEDPVLPSEGGENDG